MRPRFSLRWLLIAFAFSGFVFYLLFVRPTAIATRFVAAVENGDVDLQKSFYPSDQLQNQAYLSAAQRFNDFRTASMSIEPRTWKDFVNCRRRITASQKEIRRTEAGDHPAEFVALFEAGLSHVRYVDKVFIPAIPSTVKPYSAPITLGQE